MQELRQPLSAASPPPQQKDNASQTSSSDNPRGNPAPPSAKPTGHPADFVMSVAANISSQPLVNHDPDVWGVLTAISTNSRRRPQGLNLLLTKDEHTIGRVVADMRFRIDSATVSGNHCKIYRKRTATETADEASEGHSAVFIRDNSINGTYINWEKLKKNDPDTGIQHGDIISLAAPPDQEAAFAFVYRDATRSSPLTSSAGIKRKSEELNSESKRTKGIGIGAPEGPVSLTDFRSLQRSNKELRKQLEDQVLRIDALHSENRSLVECHEKEMKDLKESISGSYSQQIKDLKDMLDNKQKELLEQCKSIAEQKHAREDLNERLSASLQSCAEANAIVNSQKISLEKLKASLEEEREQRKEERVKAAADIKAAVQRAQADAQQELKEYADAATKHEKEHQEVIYKLQESEKERCALLDDLRLKLEETRQKLVVSDNKVRQLEAHICEEQQISLQGQKRLEELESDIGRLNTELENEKAAREEAWAKVSALELEISAAIKDLDFERRRLKGARERVMLRETQLRAFYTSTEEILVLFSKQQEQLKAMQRTLEDEENYENTSLDIDLNVVPNRNDQIDMYRRRIEEGRNIYLGDKGSKSSAALVRGRDEEHAGNSTDEASVTEKHQRDCQDTQELDLNVVDSHINHGFGSDINGVGTQPILEDENMETERVLGTESAAPNDSLNQGCDLAGETMQLDDEYKVPDTVGCSQTQCVDSIPGMPSDKPSSQKVAEDTERETASTIRTADLLTSEVAGSWACGTAPSVHGENESPRSKGEDNSGPPLPNSNRFGAESQNTPSDSVAKLGERRALAEMIGIVAPDLREKFAAGAGTQNLDSEHDSDDTEDYSGSEHAEDNHREGPESDKETRRGCNRDMENGSSGSGTDDGDDDNDETQDGGAL
ncbi:hypothetical protein MLD38_032389 [Melastoma candidum]|uniref:Uncharacterized protein n=1 Tax=Melastoma candidum TaxID=119954 RepID=A0ACB9M5B0_9MYRT|nr:hypothetical protein MLD38_032389 [Melastoma candidum]